jgi:hypothetical protein
MLPLANAVGVERDLLRKIISGLDFGANQNMEERLSAIAQAHRRTSKRARRHTLLRF